MTFNHDKEALSEALGIHKTGEDMSAQMAKLCERFIKSDDDKISNLAEMIHEELTYPEILMIATINAYEIIERSQNQSAIAVMQKLSDLIKKLKDD